MKPQLKYAGFKNAFGDRMFHCPACNTTVSELGIRNHILGKAKGELWRYYMEESTYIKHLKFATKHLRLTEIKKLQLTLK